MHQTEERFLEFVKNIYLYKILGVTKYPINNFINKNTNIYNFIPIQNCSNCLEYTIYSNINKYKLCNNCDNKDLKKSFVKIYSNMIHNAETRNLDVEINKIDIENQYYKQHGKCGLSNIQMTYYKDYDDNNDYIISLDRIDSNKPYTANNIQLVCNFVNTMKSDTNEEIFLEYIKNIHLNKTNFFNI